MTPFWVLHYSGILEFILKFLIQKLKTTDDMESILAAIKNVPHEVIDVIPFSHDLICSSDLTGNEFIPYGSTTLTMIAYENKWKGCYFDLDTFNYHTALKYRHDMLNDNVLILSTAIEELRDIIKSDKNKQVFVRPSEDLKQFSGTCISAEECYAWFNDIIECESSGSYKLDPCTPIVLSTPKNIQAEYRYFIVDGQIVTGSQYRIRNQLIKERVTESDMLIEAQSFADQWLPHPCCVMDLALVGTQLKVIEFNCINSSGFYDSDIDAIFKSLYNYSISH